MKEHQIGEAAKLAGLTVETLRHYDRIGLLHPSRTDSFTGYRFYSNEDIAQLQVISYLRSIHFSLAEIQQLFSNRNMPDTLSALAQAEQRIDRQIEQLRKVKYHLNSTLHNYSTKPTYPDWKPDQPPEIRILPEQILFLEPEMHAPTVENLLNFHDMVESHIPPRDREHFHFQNTAGLLIRGEKRCLFATCIHHKDHPNLYRLPEGRYLCGSCGQDDYETYISFLRSSPKAKSASPQAPLVLDLAFVGIIQWNYEVRLYLDS
ncbi:MAG: helix-turn-helix domain-containing protein [Lachnospiraceae bacterium]|nr:helix-turn-helix domain-containing protein [Lachnospiraceae bacterium]MCD8010808.1 helix-turn-helix domain-containing protein [Lachnospiraceae bacterium]